MMCPIFFIFNERLSTPKTSVAALKILMSLSFAVALGTLTTNIKRKQRISYSIKISPRFVLNLRHSLCATIIICSIVYYQSYNCNKYNSSTNCEPYPMSNNELYGSNYRIQYRPLRRRQLPLKTNISENRMYHRVKC